MSELEGTLNGAVDRDNRYRSPMATAEVRRCSNGSFVVRFAGPFCTTCCPDEYFEDLRFELDDLGIDHRRTTVESVTQTDLEAFDVRYSARAILQRSRSR